MNNELPTVDEATIKETEAYFDSHSTSIQIDCDFGGRIAPFPVYVGEPKDDSHPLQHQAHWLQAERGGTIPPDVMNSFATLHKISKENNVSFQMLCVYAFGEVKAQREAEAQAQTQQNQTGESEYQPYQSGYTPPPTPEVIKPEAAADDTANAVQPDENPASPQYEQPADEEDDTSFTPSSRG